MFEVLKMADRNRGVFHCCKSGDICNLQHLVEVDEIDVNQRDTWDSTPLYYACLCGHKHLVKYLLDSGAVCQAKTFDGERCLYGALTDEIRDMLKTYNAASTGHGRRNLFQEFLRQLLESGENADIHFVLQHQTHPAHKCILHARSSYFSDLLCTKWIDKTVVQIRSSMVGSESFKAMLHYIYTGYLKVHLSCVDDCIRFAKQCNMHDLIEKINERLEIIQKFVPQKPGTEINVLSLEPSQDSLQLQDDLEQLAELAIPLELRKLVDISGIPFYGEVEDAPPFADVCFSVEGHNFYCHKVFFTRRSDFFKALLADHFGEAEADKNSIKVIKLRDISANIFVKVVYYIYTDTVQGLNDVSSYDLLCKADLFLLPGLKKRCANVMAGHLTEENIINVLRVSRLFNLSKLEDQCAQFMATILERLIDTQEFADLILEDAESIELRQETDSIMIVDDIRYHISSSVQTFSAVQEAQEKLDTLDNLLVTLGVEC